jgi:hypothetical protein
LVADESEIVPAAKVKVLARESGITSGEITTCLERLKSLNKVDFITDSSGKPGDVEIYCFSASDALTTTSQLYDFLGPSDYEQASLVSLDDTFRLPHYKSEVMESLTAKGFREEIAETTLNLQDALNHIKVSIKHYISLNLDLKVRIDYNPSRNQFLRKHEAFDESQRAGRVRVAVSVAACEVAGGRVSDA